MYVCTIYKQNYGVNNKKSNLTFSCTYLDKQKSLYILSLSPFVHFYCVIQFFTAILRVISVILCRYKYRQTDRTRKCRPLTAINKTGREKVS